jgi:hypothetical protein
MEQQPDPAFAPGLTARLERMLVHRHRYVERAFEGS